MNLEHPFLEFE